MFNVKSKKTGKLAKDPITTRPHQFETAEAAQIFADAMSRESIVGATAWNSVRKTAWQVVQE